MSLNKLSSSLVQFLMMICIVSVIAISTWFAVSWLSYTPKVHGYVSDHYMKQISQDAQRGFELIQEEDKGVYRDWSEQENAQVKEAFVIINRIGYMYSLARGLVFLLFLIILWFFIIVPGFFSKNPVLNSGLIIGGLISECIIHLFALTTNFILNFAIYVLAASLIIYCYYLTYDRIKKWKKQVLLYVPRQLVITYVLSFLCAVLALELQGMFVTYISHISDLAEAIRTYIFWGASLVMAILIYGIAWRIHSAVVSSALINAVNLLLIGFTVFGMMLEFEAENLKLFGITLGMLGDLLLLVAPLVGASLLTCCVYMLRNYTGWKAWDA